jgi:hypothetical protein
MCSECAFIGGMGFHCCLLSLYNKDKDNFSLRAIAKNSSSLITLLMESKVEQAIEAIQNQAAGNKK